MSVGTGRSLVQNATGTRNILFVNESAANAANPAHPLQLFQDHTSTHPQQWTNYTWDYNLYFRVTDNPACADATYDPFNSTWPGVSRMQCPVLVYLRLRSDLQTLVRQGQSRVQVCLILILMTGINGEGSSRSALSLSAFLYFLFIHCGVPIESKPKGDVLETPSPMSLFLPRFIVDIAFKWTYQPTCNFN